MKDKLFSLNKQLLYKILKKEYHKQKIYPKSFYNTFSSLELQYINLYMQQDWNEIEKLIEQAVNDLQKNISWSTKEHIKVAEAIYSRKCSGFFIEVDTFYIELYGNNQEISIFKYSIDNYNGLIAIQKQEFLAMVGYRELSSSF